MAPGAVFQGMRKESAAFRLMKQMGWEEGSGLGKDSQGIKKHLVVKKKDDTAGVGANETHNWTFNTTDFDNLLKKLKVQVTDKPQHRQSDQPDGEESDESEIENNGSDREKEEEVEVKKVCRPQGRYKRIERGKMVRNYSKQDLESILGREQVTEKKEHVIMFVPVKQVHTKQEVKLTVIDPPAEWWGSKLGFVKAGTLGASSNCTSKNTTFSENDQEMLYKSVHDKATKGRGGLGIADRAKKIGGAHWKGQKVSFGDAEEEEELQEASKDTKRKRESGNGSDSETRSSWKKICQDFLMEAPQQKASLKKLHKHVSSTVGADSFSDIDRLRRKLSKSSRFTIEGNRVYLAPEIAA
ncbi:PIN2/TERF1-interacting telomerase inhibitor 1 [Selaginella moellendorffii]|nr:PIN2/TERF1-interacting telomerase inhibitor 1 [Selaginella moellendorffii]|eukprot:XP_002984280.2 PIN2/TERF1-interacting telomerase inhibitor 1 [Selaginella moellendorffii]